MGANARVRKRHAIAIKEGTRFQRQRERLSYEFEQALTEAPDDRPNWQVSSRKLL